MYRGELTFRTWLRLIDWTPYSSPRPIHAIAVWGLGVINCTVYRVRYCICLHRKRKTMYGSAPFIVPARSHVMCQYHMGSSFPKLCPFQVQPKPHREQFLA
jgi:hypothetical protein